MLDRRARAAREPLRDLERLCLELLLGYAERDEPDPFRLFAAERLAQEQVVLRLRHTAQQRPHDRCVIAGGDAEPRVPVDDARIRCRDRDVGEQAHDEARADGRPGHRRDDGCRTVDDVVDKVARLVEHAPPRLVVASHLIDEVEIAARAERAVRAANDHRANLTGASDRRPDCGEVAVHVCTDRVQTSCSAKREAEHAVSGPVELEGRKLVVERHSGRW